MDTAISLTDMQRDAFTETANIGAGSASNSLSEVLGKRVDITLSGINIIDIASHDLENFHNLSGTEGNQIVGITNDLTDDVKGIILFIMHHTSAVALSNLLIPEGVSDLSDKAITKLKDIGRIISSSYLKSFNEFIGTTISSTDAMFSITPSVPNLTTLHEFSTALTFRTDFKIDETDIQGKFILALAPPATHNLLDILKQKYQM